MNQFNENNPTVNWTEDEQYEVCKWENKWIKELVKTRTGGARRNGRVCDSLDDPTFSSIEELNNTFQQDIEIRKESYKHLCAICDYATNFKDCLTDHLFVHGMGKRLKCDQCDKDFATKRNLTRHIQSIHEAKEKFSCQSCQQKYTTKDGLKKHILRIHQAKTIPCDECKKMFRTRELLNKHKQSVHVLKYFKCCQCNTRFKNKGDMKKHVRSIHEKEKFSCNVCDFVGHRKDHLKVHVESVHEKKKNWFCEACPYSCYMKGHFISHMRIHTGEKPFKCNKCLTQFSHITNFKRHRTNCSS